MKSHETLRREINEGLNVVEQWNGATDFVFFARRGDKYYLKPTIISPLADNKLSRKNEKGLC
ncbi:Tn3 family transposase [Photorhabdus khanii]|uniref:Tn3 family transposase n=1 Tax=Photorhabdus khanii TaxID=1004150 RepID=UPI00104513DA|nr:Tn3 family transposase [Photorhabdus khanii]